MKEARYFYVPNAVTETELPADRSNTCIACSPIEGRG